jgi:thiol-disulfide isomerase/thioredoxin
MRLAILLTLSLMICPTLLRSQTLPEDVAVIDSGYNNLDDLFAMFSGQVVYINFWASWCKPCLEEMPHSNQLYEALRGKPITILFLAVNDREDPWRSRISTLPVKGTHVLLNTDLSRQVRQRFGIGAIPHYAILNKEGDIEYVSTLPPSYPNTEQDLLKLLEP